MTALGRGESRLDRMARWWAGLSELDRERARYFAATPDRLSRQLFLGLCDTGVLAVDTSYRDRVADGSASTFAMPPDIQAYVRGASIASVTAPSADGLGGMVGRRPESTDD